jgi:hypothetical protein
MVWPDDLIATITTYAESIGIDGAEVDVQTHWSGGEGAVRIQTGPFYGCAGLSRAIACRACRPGRWLPL